MSTGMLVFFTFSDESPDSRLSELPNTFGLNHTNPITTDSKAAKMIGMILNSITLRLIVCFKNRKKI